MKEEMSLSVDQQLTGKLDKKELILFDGVCNLCNNSVDFIIRRDKKGIFLFTSLQSETGQEILKHFQLPSQDFETVLLLREGRMYKKSGAALRIARHLNAPWPVLYVFIWLPAFIRDFFYDLIAKNRYKLFGKKDSCRLPTAEERSLFI